MLVIALGELIEFFSCSGTEALTSLGAAPKDNGKFPKVKAGVFAADTPVKLITDWATEAVGLIAYEPLNVPKLSSRRENHLHTTAQTWLQWEQAAILNQAKVVDVKAPIGIRIAEASKSDWQRQPWLERR